MRYQAGLIWKLFMFTAAVVVAAILFWNPILKLKAESLDAQNHSDSVQEVGSISGRVLDEFGNGIAQIGVSVKNLTTQSSAGYLVTDASGIYTFTNLAIGSYAVCTTYSGYENAVNYVHECFDNKRYPEAPTPVVLSSGAPTRTIDFVLSSGAHIAGTIRNESGQAIEGIELRAYYVVPGVGWQSYRTALSDAQGNYTLIGLVANTYRVCALDGEGYLGECYDDVATIEAAQDIVLANDQRVSGYDFQLRTGGVIAGKVVDSQGQLVPYMRIDTFDSTGAMAQAPFRVQENGLFTITGLISDSYRLQIVNPYPDFNPYIGEFYQDATSLDTATQIPVQVGGTVSGITFQIGKRAVVRGRVTDLQNQPLRYIYVTAEPVVTNQAAALTKSVIVRYTRTDDRGDYWLALDTSGTYNIKFSDIGGVPDGQGYVEEYYDDSPTVAGATPVTIGAEAEVSNINAQLSRKGSISGTVQDDKGNPLPGIRINFYNEAQTYLDQYGRVTDQNGKFEISALAAGNYRICVADQMLPYEFASGCYLNATSVASATNIAVANNVVTKVVIPMGRLGGITGTVKNSLNAPIANASVQLLVKKEIDEILFFEELGSTLTDSSGKYTFSGLLASSPTYQYFISVSDVLSGSLVYYVGEFYENQPNRDSATQITVQNQKMTTVDFQLAFGPSVNSNTPPSANNDALTVVRGATSSVLTGGATSLLANDVDAENAPLTATVVTNPSNGALTLNANGTFTYKHNNSKTTSDLFSYRASDGVNQSNIATVTITIKPLVSFEFSKTVSILGIEPACGAVGTMKVPVTTTINYCYSITNSGDVTLTTHSLIDDKLGTLLNNAAITLAPGATHRVQFSQTLTVNTTNIATWTATSNVAGLTAAELDEADVALGVKQATITISAPTDDQDGDTIPDNLESAGDADGDNLPNFLDTDANGNGTPDASEAGANPLAPVDSNGNGVPDYLDLTSPDGGQNTKKVYLPVVSR